MSILAIETATSVCGAAVVSGGVVNAIAQVDEKNVHAERLLPLIESVLHKADTTLAKIEAIAVSIGPGSFTGLRIGLSVAKGLAYSTAKPLVAVPTLEALALRVMQETEIKPGTPILAAIDARRDEVYCQLYSTRNGRLEAVWDVCDLTVGEVRTRIGEQEVIVTGDAQNKIGEGWKNAAATFADARFAGCSASTVALIGEREFRAGVRDDASTLEPRYIKEFFLKVR